VELPEPDDSGDKHIEAILGPEEEHSGEQRAM
jgi:hypothetical protein